MNDAALIAILVAAFLLAIGLVHGLDRLISKDAVDKGAARRGFADEAPPIPGGRRMYPLRR
jgi:hypothetical protein